MNLSAFLPHVERMVIVTACLLAGIFMIGIGWFTKAPNAGGFREVLDSSGTPILDGQGAPQLEFVPPSLIPNFTYDLIPSLITLAGVGCILFSVFMVIRPVTPKRKNPNKTRHCNPH